jgi:DNA-binding transcriptional ArsR family regulator
MIISMVVQMSKGEVGDEHALARIYSALGEPTRVRVLRVLATGGEMSCGQLAQQVDITASTGSHHISELMDCGLLQMRKKGRFHLLSVRRDVLAKFAPAILADRQDAP